MPFTYMRSAVRAPALLRGTLSLFALVTFVFSSTPALAQQTGSVQGRVISAGSGEPMPGVTVHVPGTSRGAVSDAQGRFLLLDLPPGNREVLAERIGLDPQRQTVTVTAGTVARIEFRLSEQALLLPQVVVSATREARRLSQTAATVNAVSSRELQDAKPTHPAGIMGQIPGVWVNVTGGEGHTTAIRQPRTTNPVYLYLEDGIPTRSTGFYNHNALYEVNIPQAERIEVLKGPATALYGSDAIGGIINVETRRPTLFPSVEAFAEGGAHGWSRLLASGSGGWGQSALRTDVNLTRTDGWREGTAYDRQSGTLRWDQRFSPVTTLKTVATFSRIDQATAGSSAISREDFEENPTLNYTPISFRKVRAVRLSSAFERQGEATLFSLTPYARWNAMEMLPNWTLASDPAVSSSGHSSVGLLAKQRLDLPALRTRVIAGVDVDYSPGSRIEHRVQATREGKIWTAYTPGDLVYDYDVTYRALSPYLQAEVAPVERLNLTAGLRYDYMGYDYDSKLEPLETGRWRRPADATVNYTHLSPKLGAAYEFGRALNAFASYSHGFRAPSESQLFRQGQAVNTIGLNPVEANSYEAGIRGELFGRLGYGISAYHMVVNNDILGLTNPDGTRETVNAGETLHRGIEVGLGAALTSELRLNVSYSRAKHTYEHWQPRPDLTFDGNEIEAAPRTIANTRLVYTPRFLRESRLSLEWSRIGSYWMDPENSHEYEGHDLLNLQGNVPVTGQLEIIARVMNLMDERFAESASYTVARGEEFAPGMPRTVYAGVQYRWRR